MNAAVCALSHLADLSLALGTVDQAVRLGRELVATLRTQRAPSTLCVALLNLVNALLARGDTEDAATLAPEAGALALDVGLLWLAADDLAWVAALQGRFEAAALLIGCSRRAAPTHPARERTASAVPAAAATRGDALHGGRRASTAVARRAAIVPVATDTFYRAGSLVECRW